MVEYEPDPTGFVSPFEYGYLGVRGGGGIPGGPR